MPRDQRDGVDVAGGSVDGEPQRNPPLDSRLPGKWRILGCHECAEVVTIRIQQLGIIVCLRDGERSGVFP